MSPRSGAGWSPASGAASSPISVAGNTAEARRLGGLRRKRERTLAGAYDLAGLDSIAAIQRLLDIAVLDTLALENSVARSRVLMGAVAAATKLIDAEREAAMGWDVE